MRLNGVKNLFGKSSVGKSAESAPSAKPSKSKPQSAAPSELSSRPSTASMESASSAQAPRRFSISNMLSRSSSPANSSGSLPSVSPEKNSPASSGKFERQLTTSTVSDISTASSTKTESKPQEQASAPTQSAKPQETASAASPAKTESKPEKPATAPAENAKPLGAATFEQAFQMQMQAVGAHPTVAKATHSFLAKDSGLKDSIQFFGKALTNIEMGKQTYDSKPPELIEQQAKEAFISSVGSFIQMHQNVSQGVGKNKIVNGQHLPGAGAIKTAEILYDSIKANQSTQVAHTAS